MITTLKDFSKNQELKIAAGGRDVRKSDSIENFNKSIVSLH